MCGVVVDAVGFDGHQQRNGSQTTMAVEKIITASLIYILLFSYLINKNALFILILYSNKI